MIEYSHIHSLGRGILAEAVNTVVEQQFLHQFAPDEDEVPAWKTCQFTWLVDTAELLGVDDPDYVIDANGFVEILHGDVHQVTFYDNGTIALS